MKSINNITNNRYCYFNWNFKNNSVLTCDAFADRDITRKTSFHQKDKFVLLLLQGRNKNRFELKAKNVTNCLTFICFWL